MATSIFSSSVRIAKGSSYKWLLGLVMVTVIALGWKYPLLGFVVPMAMTTGVIGGLFRGRWACGNLCPRGSFLDTWMNLVSPKREIPALLKNQSFRWLALASLMSFMVYRLSQNIGSPTHWGYVFWQMCLLTTILAVGLGLGYASRSWCSFCPVGTMASSIGGNKYLLQIHPSCKTCGACEKSCPMQLQIVKHKPKGALVEKDCLKCSACVNACPRSEVLTWPIKEAA